MRKRGVVIGSGEEGGHPSLARVVGPRPIAAACFTKTTSPG